MMARQVPSAEFAQVLASLTEQETWVFIRPTIQFEVTGLNGGTLLYLYEYREDENLLYAALKFHKFEKPMLMVNTNREDGEFDKRAAEALLPLLFDKIKDEPIFETVLPSAVDRQFLQWFRDEVKSHPHVPMNEPTHAYVVTREGEKALFETDVTLPPGYEAGSLEPYHAKQMISLLLHAQNGDEDQAAIRLAEFPSVGIFEETTGKLVAFEYNDGIGSIAHQYVYPEHRGKGLGKAIEVLICRKNIQELGIRPAKCVAKKRPKVEAITQKAGYWSYHLDCFGEKTLTWWTLYCKEFQEPILIFDN